MTLLLAEPGPLRDAIARELKDVAVTTVEDDDLVTAACGREAIVYLPAARLLDALHAPNPDARRAREALRAAHAPGVSLAVFVVPEGDGYREELDVLEQDGTPYMVVAAPALVEELGTTLPKHGTLLLPRSGSMRAADACAVATAVREALTTEEQGRIVTVGAEASPATLFKRAAQLSSLRVRILALWTPLYRLARWLWRLFRRPEPALYRELRLLASPPP